MSGFVTLHEVFNCLGIPYKTAKELAMMTPEDRQKYYKENTWSRGKYDKQPINFNLAVSEDDEEGGLYGNLLLYFDDRWMEDKNDG